MLLVVLLLIVLLLIVLLLVVLAARFAAVRAAVLGSALAAAVVGRRALVVLLLLLLLLLFAQEGELEVPLGVGVLRPGLETIGVVGDRHVPLLGVEGEISELVERARAHFGVLGLTGALEGGFRPFFVLFTEQRETAIEADLSPFAESSDRRVVMP